MGVDGTRRACRWLAVHINVEAGRAAVDRCVASGPRIHHATSDEEAEFFIKARDHCGNLCSAGIENFSVSMEGPPVMSLGGMTAQCDVVVEAVPGAKGTFRCSYTPQFAGFYKLIVRQGKSHSPARPSTCASSPQRPSSYSAYGRGLRKQWYTGREARFVVIARDKYANKLTVGGGDCVQVHHVVGFTRREKFEGEVIDNGNGTYSCTYTPQEVGPARIDLGMVRYDPRVEREKSSPSAKVPSRSISRLTSCPPSTARRAGRARARAVQAATMTRFIIEARDKLSNALGGGGDEFEVHIKDREASSRSIISRIWTTGLTL